MSLLKYFRRNGNEEKKVIKQAEEIVKTAKKPAKKRTIKKK